MKYNKLGNSGLFVSEICFGVMSFTGDKGWTHIAHTNQKEANYQVALAIDYGVNFFDTADIYSNGISEKMLGKALGKKRNDVIIATKFGFRMKEGPNGDGLSRKRIIEACNDSLKRLNTDYIDLYQIHSYDFVTPLEETLSTLNELIKQGKVRYIGLSNFYAWQIMKAQAICERNSWEKFISNQAFYTILSRELEYEQIDVCMDQGIGIIVWGPLHGGYLSGKYRNIKKWPKGTRLNSPDDLRPLDINKTIKVFAEMEKISKSRNVTFSQIAINYLLRKKGITSVVIGVRNRKQLIDNLKASTWKLNDEEMEMLDFVSQPSKLYPQWYFETYRRNQLDRLAHQ
ncbi:aldo/keto reductase [Ignavibacteria bacterium 4148-Me]|uniref:aldo/keto reductase n=1 Tax=Rosettibacter primus TaxID=3111523 RepID=UPI00336C069B